MTGMRAERIAQRNLKVIVTLKGGPLETTALRAFLTGTIIHYKEILRHVPHMASPKTFFVPNISPSRPPGTWDQSILTNDPD